MAEPISCPRDVATLAVDPERAITAVVVNYNGARTLPATLRSILAAWEYVSEAIVVDDGSTDGSAELVEREFPAVRVIRLGRNTGIINLARNTGLMEVRTPFVFLTDNDITFQPESLRRLRDVAESSADVAIVTPRLLDSERPETLFYDGNRLHFLGLSAATTRGRPALPPSDPRPRPTFGGGIMLIRASLGRRLGWMDTGYVPGWGSDAEFQLRARLHGFQALHDPLAVMTHVGKVHGTSRALGQMSNRYRLMLTYYSALSLLLLSPSLLTFEVVLSVAAIPLGVFAFRWRAMSLIFRQLGPIARRRAELQRARVAADHELMEGGAFELPRFIAGNRALRAVARGVEALLEANWRLCAWASRLRARRAAPGVAAAAAKPEGAVVAPGGTALDADAAARTGAGDSVNRAA